MIEVSEPTRDREGEGTHALLLTAGPLSLPPYLALMKLRGTLLRTRTGPIHSFGTIADAWRATEFPLSERARITSG